MYSILLFSVLFIVLLIVSAIAEAIMDTVDFKFTSSVFNRPNKETKIFGIKWNLWWDQSAGWKNRYIDHDTSKGLRKIKIAGIALPSWFMETISDAWHFFKAVMILSERIIMGLLVLTGTQITELLPAAIMAIVIISVSIVLRQVVFEYFLNKLIE
jgi:hypothetical protein